VLFLLVVGGYCRRRRDNVHCTVVFLGVVERIILKWTLNIRVGQRRLDPPDL
jgi:predicted membrane protein